MKFFNLYIFTKKQLDRFVEGIKRSVRGKVYEQIIGTKKSRPTPERAGPPEKREG